MQELQRNKPNQQERLKKMKNIDRIHANVLFEADDAYYATALDFNALLKIDKKTWEADFLCCFPGEKSTTGNLFMDMARYGKFLCFAPSSASRIFVLDLEEESFQCLDIPVIEKPDWLHESYKKRKGPFFHKILRAGSKMFFLPRFYQAIVVYDFSDGTVATIDSWLKPINDMLPSELEHLHSYFQSGVADLERNCLVVAALAVNAVVTLDLDTYETKVHRLVDNMYGYTAIAQVGREFWLLPIHKPSLIKWDMDDGSVTHYDINLDGIPHDGYDLFFKLYHHDGSLFLIPFMSERVVSFCLKNKTFSFVEGYLAQTDVAPSNPFTEGDKNYKPCANHVISREHCGSKVFLQRRQDKFLTDFDMATSSFVKRRIKLRNPEKLLQKGFTMNRKYVDLGSITATDFVQIDDLFRNFIPKYKEIFLFGTGNFARAVCKFLSECGVEVSGFVVSSLLEQKCGGEGLLLNVAKFKQRYKESEPDSIGLIMSIGMNFYNEVLPQLQFMGNHLYFMSEKHKQLAERRFLENNKIRFLWHITDHCNLSCYGCKMASPIAPIGFYDFGQFTQELHRMAKLFDNNAHISFSGGEPLLHPQLFYFLYEARKTFTGCQIDLLTNGLLLGSQDDFVMKCIADLNINIIVTRHPIPNQAPYALLESKARQFGLTVNMAQKTSTESREQWLLRWAPRKTGKPHDFLFCPFHNLCIVVDSGRIYTCNNLKAVKFIKQRFIDVALPNQESSGLDIYKANDAKEVLQFLTRKTPLCDYCDIRGWENIGEYRTSQKERDEWLTE